MVGHAEARLKIQAGEDGYMAALARGFIGGIPAIVQITLFLFPPLYVLGQDFSLQRLEEKKKLICFGLQDHYLVSSSECGSSVNGMHVYLLVGVTPLCLPHLCTFFLVLVFVGWAYVGSPVHALVLIVEVRVKL